MPEGKRNPNIGVISDCALQRHMIQKALNNYGLQVSLSFDPSLLAQQNTQRLQQIRCWILVLEDEDYESPELNELIEQSEAPVLFGLGKAPDKSNELYISWERRLISKLEELIGKVTIFESVDSLLSLQTQGRSKVDQTLLESEPETSVFLSQQKKQQQITPAPHIPASEVWVLAASLGGPGAIKTFLDRIPAAIRASFLYAQHIDAHFSQVLTQVLGRHAKLNLLALENGYPLYDGEIRMVPVDREVLFDGGVPSFTSNKWPGPYGPSIDHLLKNVLAAYGAKCNLIVFSGMGNDGALMAPVMRRAGCRIWTQSPDSCASASMPQAVIDLNCSDFTGTPEQLAQALIDAVGCHEDHPLTAEQFPVHRGQQ
jgi:chemosensory pili system protein ChpB (putative protein-glutamate methylesterase)